jgi:hypothetical protein
LFRYSSYAGLMNTYMSQDDIQWTRGQGLLDANYNKGVDTGVTSVIDKLEKAETRLRKTNKAAADAVAKVIRELSK